MKERINKTIITKKGGTIVIPNKIIGKEYPSNGGDVPTPTPPTPVQEPDLYIIDVHIAEFLDNYKLSNGNFLVRSGEFLKSDITTINATSKFSLILMDDNGAQGNPVIDTYKLTTVEVGTVTGFDPYTYAGDRLVFITPIKETALYIISCFDAYVVYETNFDVQ